VKQKKKISASAVLADIRSGIKDIELMEKYRLSSKGLQSVFQKLVLAELVTALELKNRFPSYEDTADLANMREVNRCFPIIRIEVVDMDEPEKKKYYARNLSQKGLQVAGMRAKIGVKKRFIIEANEFVNSDPIYLEAECRWSDKKGDTGLLVSGFEITNISERSQNDFMTLIGVVTFCSE
jgi:hypothetical protein